jgi:hypothetical protein
VIGTFPKPRCMIAARSAFVSRSQFAHMSHKTACALRALSAAAGVVPGDRRRVIRLACSIIVLGASRPDRPIPTPNSRTVASATGSRRDAAGDRRSLTHYPGAAAPPLDEGLGNRRDRDDAGRPHRCAALRSRDRAAGSSPESEKSGTSAAFIRLFRIQLATPNSPGQGEVESSSSRSTHQRGGTTGRCHRCTLFATLTAAR